MKNCWLPTVVIAVLASTALAASPDAPVRIEQVRALPPLPAAYLDEASFDKRAAWLLQRLTTPLDAAERYRTQRVLAMEYVGEHRMGDATQRCQAAAPLREDILYREQCIVASAPAYEEHVSLLLSLADEARALGNAAAAAQVLKDAAWRQSQAGDIAGAFGDFEAALSVAPADRADLLDDIMMDTASSYIVNGDETYIRKGIQLLADARSQMERALAAPGDASDKEVLKDNIQLTEFNRGIAYLLHLDDPKGALAHFDRAVQQPSSIREDALVFGAVAASDIGHHDQARAWLRQADTLKAGAGGEVVQRYLQCYRQLAIRRWNADQPLSACVDLKKDTAAEVQLDVFKRLSRSEDPAVALAGLKGLKTLFLEKMEPQLRRRGSTAASHAELKRLQRESELKTVVLQQQAELQRERDRTVGQRQNYFVALSLFLLTAMLLVALQWRAKKRLAAQYERLSVVDALTQLGNRRHLEQQIGRELAQLERTRRRHPEASLGVYLFDIDHFKSINDRFGHVAGDAVLVTFGRRLKAATRDTDLLVRWGGEEFLLVARLDTPADGERIAERVLEAVNGQPFELAGHDPLAVTCTIGAVRVPFLGGNNAPHWPALVGLADLALYEGKARGRDRWVLVDNRGLQDAQALAQALQVPLRQSIDEGRVGVTTPEPVAA